MDMEIGLLLRCSGIKYTASYARFRLTVIRFIILEDLTCEWDKNFI